MILKENVADAAVLQLLENWGGLWMWYVRDKGRRESGTKRAFLYLKNRAVEAFYSLGGWPAPSSSRQLTINGR
jgi:hypothetical protein